MKSILGTIIESFVCRITREMNEFHDKSIRSMTVTFESMTRLKQHVLSYVCVS
jgi:hypothetical protein